ncbi:MAG: uracil phosphoribosyltransferase [Candidatus Kapaibacterium sp.]
MKKAIAHLSRKTTLDITNINTLNNLFKFKEWDSLLAYENYFARYCILFELLNEEQRKLILELTKNYLYFPNEEYQKHFYSLLKKVVKDYKLKCEKIFITTLLVPVDESNEFREIKSPDNLLYLTTGAFFKRNIDFNGIEFVIKERIDLLPDKIEDNWMVLLIDDFIGTGETAISAISYLRRIKEVEKTNIKVLSLVSLKEGVQEISKKGIEVITGITLNKAISEYYISPEKEEKIKIMITIENLIKGLKPNFKFGYLGSEALVTLIKTPDNTFPIFWKDFDNGAETIEAPFQRD